MKLVFLIVQAKPTFTVAILAQVLVFLVSSERKRERESSHDAARAWTRVRAFHYAGAHARVSDGGSSTTIASAVIVGTAVGGSADTGDSGVDDEGSTAVSSRTVSDTSTGSVYTPQNPKNKRGIIVLLIFSEK